MTNPILGFDEMAAAQSQPEVVINAADRAITRALAGEVVIDLTTDADYELGADEWPYRVIRVTDDGNVLTAARSLVFPDISPLEARPIFVLVNDTAQTITIKGDSSGSTGVAVSAGSEALVRYDGEDVIEVAAGGGGSAGPAPVVSHSGASLTATPGNAGNYTRFSHGSASYVFDGAQSYAANAEYHGRYVGAGVLEISGVNGFTVNPPAGGSLSVPPDGTFTVKIVSPTEADLFGVTEEST